MSSRRVYVSGFRLRAPMDSEKQDEFLVFQGPSYFRALGTGQLYGESARGGRCVNLAVLGTQLARNVGFPAAQTAAMLAAMTSNYFLNNAFTYRDRRHSGWRILTGLASFGALCGLGIVAGVGLSTLLHQDSAQWWMAGFAGALTSVIWNYATTSNITWRA